MDALALFVSAPVAAFRVPHAREYLETLPCPPPATVYGMLLSLVGEERRHTHIGAQVAMAMISEPRRSTVLRTSWRLKSNKPQGIGDNKRPDYQELLCDVRLAVWLRAGEREAAARPLVERVRAVVDRQESPSRYGALALGESTHLVDEIRRLRASDDGASRLVDSNPEGDLALPVWVDHIGSIGTRWGQYQFAPFNLGAPPPDSAWTEIQPLGGGG